MTYVYKYMSIDTKCDERNFFKNLKITYNTAKNFNDPLEFVSHITGDEPEINFNMSLNLGPTLPIIIEKCAIDVNHMQKFSLNVDDILSKVRFTCFSEVNPLRITTENTSLLMWAHYANSHKGICIVLNGESDRVKSSHSVRYSNAIQCLDFTQLKTASHIQMLYSKHSCWSYEKEIRHAMLPEKLEQVANTNGCCLDTLNVNEIKLILLGINADHDVMRISGSSGHSFRCEPASHFGIVRPPISV
ncbi:DUF2971 domain-containing protein [Rheinheimera sediminis]|nr:DUF2971 domain-containing protein [Rheinheimera sp. YQF-1]